MQKRRSRKSFLASTLTMMALSIASAGVVLLQSAPAHATQYGSNCNASSKIEYRVYRGGQGWSVWYCDGDIAGSVNESRQLEALEVYSLIPGVSVCYDVHAAGIGWMGAAAGNESCDGTIAGTTGQNRRIEAAHIRLTGTTETSVFSYAYEQDYGWYNRAFDWAMVGTTGQGRRMEAIKIWTAARPACPSGTNYYPFAGGEGFALGFYYNFDSNICYGGQYAYNSGIAQVYVNLQSNFSRSGTTYSFNDVTGKAYSVWIDDHDRIVGGYRVSNYIGHSTAGP
ncbi:MAG TPA: hypothetical protein VN253_25890 [Kofleriaceae bacterium]|nr:hypothetical protein [Kofleriaceae bacterium]